MHLTSRSLTSGTFCWAPFSLTPGCSLGGLLCNDGLRSKRRGSDVLQVMVEEGDDRRVADHAALRREGKVLRESRHHLVDGRRPDGSLIGERHRVVERGVLEDD